MSNRQGGEGQEIRPLLQSITRPELEYSGALGFLKGAIPDQAVGVNLYHGPRRGLTKPGLFVDRSVTTVAGPASLKVRRQLDGTRLRPESRDRLAVFQF